MADLMARAGRGHIITHWSNILGVMMHTIMFRYEPFEGSHEDKRSTFKHVISTWAKSGRVDKISNIFGPEVGLSCPLPSLTNPTVFEINITHQDQHRNLQYISSEDLAIALGLNPFEWTIWKKM